MPGLVVRTLVFLWPASVTCAWSMSNRWPLCSLTIRHGSTNQADSLPPPAVGKWVVIHVLRITGVETIKRQTRAAYGWLVVGQSVGADLAYSLSAVRLLSVTWTAPLQLPYAACGAIQVIYAFVAFTCYVLPEKLTIPAVVPLMRSCLVTDFTVCAVLFTFEVQRCWCVRRTYCATTKRTRKVMRWFWWLGSAWLTWRFW